MQAADLQGILRWIFGFPRQRGPGKLLNPYLSTKRLRFTLEFARRVLDGEPPAPARRNACNAALTGKDAKADDKTLARWLLEGLGLKEPPKTQMQWRGASSQFVARLKGQAFEQALCLMYLGPSDPRLTFIELLLAEGVGREGAIKGGTEDRIRPQTESRETPG